MLAGLGEDSLACKSLVSLKTEPAVQNAMSTEKKLKRYIFIQINLKKRNMFLPDNQVASISLASALKQKKVIIFRFLKKFSSLEPLSISDMGYSGE